MSDTIKKIYKGWAEERYPEQKFMTYKVADDVSIELERAAYTTALEERLEDVACAFGEWYHKDVGIPNPQPDAPKQWDYASVMGVKKSFQYFINNIYNGKGQNC